MSKTTLEILRIVMLLPQLVIWYYFIEVYGFQKHLWYFTTWSLDLVIFSLAISIYLGRFKGSKQLELLGTALNEISLISQIFVVMIYWPVLHKPTLEFISKAPNYEAQY